MEQGVMETVEILGGLERRVHFAVSSAEIDKRVAARLANIGRTTVLPGFRPGKVPKRIIEATHGRSTRLEVLSELISASVNRILSDQQLRIAGEPTIEPEEALSFDVPELRFRAKFEVFPEVEVEGIERLEIEHLDVTVGEAEVDQTIEVLRRRYATWSPSDGPSGKGDRLVIDLEGWLDDGTPFESGSIKSYLAEPGQGVMDSEFEEGLLGRSKGESFDLPVRLAENYPAAEFAGRVVRYHVKVHEVRVPELPALGADFAIALGIADGDFTRLRAEVRRNLEREVKQRIGDRVKAQVMGGLEKLARFEVPRALVEVEANALMESARKQAAEFNKGNDKPELNAEEFAPLARKRVGLSLIIERLVNQHNLQAKPEQLRQIVERIASAYEKPAEMIRHYLSDRERMANVGRIAIEDNVVDFVLARARVAPRKIPLKALLSEAHHS
jgi:trigger factor